jgi:hypothetical protein
MYSFIGARRGETGYRTNLCNNSNLIICAGAITHQKIYNHQPIVSETKSQKRLIGIEELMHAWRISTSDAVKEVLGALISGIPGSTLEERIEIWRGSIHIPIIDSKTHPLSMLKIGRDFIICTQDKPQEWILYPFGRSPVPNGAIDYIPEEVKIQICTSSLNEESGDEPSEQLRAAVNWFNYSESSSSCIVGPTMKEQLKGIRSVKGNLICEKVDDISTIYSIKLAIDIKDSLNTYSYAWYLFQGNITTSLKENIGS